MSEPLVGHVDVAGDDRIDGIAARGDTVVLEAVEAEVIDGWQINIGQQSMPFRVGYGLYRTPSVAASGAPAMLRHRFWQSPAREQVSGRKYIGLLLYASERDDYRYTMLAGSEPVGTVRPARWDNRRHLIVAERPIEILGGGVPFTVRAEGTGPCYLEKVLFLGELPEASTFAPRLDRLSTRVSGHFSDSGLSVSTTVADEDAAMRLLNWVYQTDASGHHTGGWGKQGVGWDFDADGFGRALPTKDPDFLGEAAFRMMSDVGRLSSNALYHTLRDMDRRVADRAFLETRDVIAFADDRDRQRHNDLRAQIGPVISEWMARFATGQADVDSQWDEYLAELNKAGLEEYEQLKQDNLVEGVPHLQPLSQFLN